MDMNSRNDIVPLFPIMWINERDRTNRRAPSVVKFYLSCAHRLRSDENLA